MEASISYGFLSCVKLIFTCSPSNQYSPFSAHDDIVALTEMKKPHKHIVHTLYFYQVCASNVVIYDIDKFLLCRYKIHFFKLVVLISTQLACKYCPGMELFPSFFLSLFFNLILVQRVKIVFLDSSAWWWTLHYFALFSGY